ncbi:MAG: hypothetical protein ACLFUU_11255 [Desulfobacteraceae bacterium]
MEFKPKEDFPDFFVLKLGVADAEGRLKVLERFTEQTVADDQPGDYIESQVNDVSPLIRVEFQDITLYLVGVSISQDLSGQDWLFSKGSEKPPNCLEAGHAAFLWRSPGAFFTSLCQHVNFFKAV